MHYSGFVIYTQVHMKPKPEQSFLHKMACRSFLVISVSLYLNDLKKKSNNLKLTFLKEKEKK